MDFSFSALTTSAEIIVMLSLPNLFAVVAAPHLPAGIFSPQAGRRDLWYGQRTICLLPVLTGRRWRQPDEGQTPQSPRKRLRIPRIDIQDIPRRFSRRGRSKEEDAFGDILGEYRQFQHRA